MPPEAVVNAADADSIYEVPLVLHDEGLDEVVCRHLGLEGDIDLSEWEVLVDRIEHLERKVRVGLIGKYVSLKDAYLSVAEAIRHARLPPRRRGRDRVDPGRGGRGPAGRPGAWPHLDGIVIPGGFGERGTEGKIAAAAVRARGAACRASASAWASR